MAEPARLPIIAEAVATAVQSRQPFSQAVELAMSNAVHAASKECEEIWGDIKLSVEDKQKRISTIMDPVVLRERMLAARNVALGRPPRVAVPSEPSVKR